MRTPLEMVIKYKEMESIIPNSGMLREVMWQYADMANGGEGGTHQSAIIKTQHAEN